MKMLVIKKIEFGIIKLIHERANINLQFNCSYNQP